MDGTNTTHEIAAPAPLSAMLTSKVNGKEMMVSCAVYHTAASGLCMTLFAS